MFYVLPLLYVSYNNVSCFHKIINCLNKARQWYEEYLFQDEEYVRRESGGDYFNEYFSTLN
jgi:hypothetical protein